MDKNGKRLHQLLVALLIGVLLLVIFQNKSFFSRPKKFFSKNDIQKIENIVIITQSSTVSIYTEKEQWVASDEKTKSKQIISKAKINTLYSTILGLNKNEIISKNGAKYDEFNVSGSTRIELHFKNSLVHLPGKKSKTIIIYIGSTDYRGEIYFRVNTDPTVYATKNDIKSAILIQ